jgi:hypothetical protein
MANVIGRIYVPAGFTGDALLSAFVFGQAFSERSCHDAYSFEQPRRGGAGAYAGAEEKRSRCPTAPV